jgi:hypothetical protein
MRLTALGILPFCAALAVGLVVPTAFADTTDTPPDAGIEAYPVVGGNFSPPGLNSGWLAFKTPDGVLCEVFSGFANYSPPSAMCWAAPGAPAGQNVTYVDASGPGYFTYKDPEQADVDVLQPGQRLLSGDTDEGATCAVTFARVVTCKTYRWQNNPQHGFNLTGQGAFFW